MAANISMVKKTACPALNLEKSVFRNRSRDNEVGTIPYSIVSHWGGRDRFENKINLQGKGYYNCCCQ